MDAGTRAPIVGSLRDAGAVAEAEKQARSWLHNYLAMQTMNKKISDLGIFFVGNCLRIMIVPVVQITTDRLDIMLTPFKSGNILPAIYFGYQAFPVGNHFLVSPMYLLGVTFQTMILIKHRPPMIIKRGLISGKSNGYTKDENKQPFKQIVKHFNLQCGVNN